MKLAEYIILTEALTPERLARLWRGHAGPYPIFSDLLFAATVFLDPTKELVNVTFQFSQVYFESRGGVIKLDRQAFLSTRFEIRLSADVPFLASEYGVIGTAPPRWRRILSNPVSSCTLVLEKI